MTGTTLGREATFRTPPPTTRQPWGRLAAWLIDWLCVCAWVAVLVAVGAVLYYSGATDDVSSGAINVIGFLVLILPVTLALARLEAGAQEGTIGKRARGLRVLDARTGSRASFRRTLTRNALKIALPWEFAHTVVFALVATGDGGGVPAWLVAVTVATYVLPFVYVMSLFVGRGRTPYDRIAGTIVSR